MDDQLRALERAARAAPDDRTAGWALVRGLERAGDEVGSWRERCRLARAGDDDAWEALRWTPRGARRAGRVVERRLSQVERVQVGEAGAVVMARDLALLDRASLETRWSSPLSSPIAHVLFAGPFLLHPDGSFCRTLVVRDVRTGQEVMRHPLPLSVPSSADEWSVFVTGISADEVVADVHGRVPDGRRRHRAVLRLLEAGSARVIREPDPPRFGPERIDLIRDLVLDASPRFPAAPPAETVARALDGQERWRLPGTTVGVDARGVLLAVERPVRALHAVDLSGRSRWTAELGMARAHFAPDAVLLEERPQRRGGEVAIRLSTRSHADGSPGWERVLTGPVGTQLQLHGLTSARGVTYALLVRPGSERAEVQALDTTTGLTLWSSSFVLAAPFDPEIRDPEIIPGTIDDGLLVIEQSGFDGEGVVLHRLGAP